MNHTEFMSMAMKRQLVHGRRAARKAKTAIGRTTQQAGDAMYRTGQTAKSKGGGFWDSLLGRQYRAQQTSAGTMGTRALNESNPVLRDRFSRASQSGIDKMKEEGARTVRNRLKVGAAVGGTAAVGGIYAATKHPEGYMDEVNRRVKANLERKGYLKRDFSTDYADLCDAFEFSAARGGADQRLIALNDLIDHAIAGDSLGE